MPTRSIPFRSLPGISRLAADHSEDAGQARQFFGVFANESISYGQAARAVRYPPLRRGALVEALSEQNPGHPALAVLARPETLVVATGQQVGLLGGPAYTLYKALTAARLATRLSEQGLPAVPVFWMATEDHDFAEVNHCWVFDRESRPVRIESGGSHAQRPVGGIQIEGDPAAQLRAALRDMPFAAEVLDVVEAAYTPGRTYGEAFRDLLARLLGAYGVLLLDPLRPAIRRLAAPILGDALERAPALVALLQQRNSALEAAGYHAQVRVEPSSSLLFVLEDGRRLPIRPSGGAARGPAEALSPNALLRPVVQDYMMPTVATVMGPAEVAYMAQSAVLYRELLGRMPVVTNRASFTLLDSRCAKLMERYGLALSALEQGEAAVRERISRKLVPPAVRQNLEETLTATVERLSHLRAGLVTFDPTLAEAMDRSSRKILYQLGKLDRKVGREALRRDQRTSEEARRLCGLLYPQRQIQERFYSILPFLAVHGMTLVDRVYESIDLDTSDHRLLPL